MQTSFYKGKQPHFLNISSTSIPTYVEKILTKKLREILSDVLPYERLGYVYNSYDVIGNIAVIRGSDVTEECAQKIANALMSIHKNVKTVLAQVGRIEGDFRLRNLKYVAGKQETITTHRESGCQFRVDVERCYFSPRLSHERMRIAKLVKKGELVVNMFAGVGCFSIVIARHSKVHRVYSIDINPVAFEFMKENTRLNGIYGKVIPVLDDSRNFVMNGLSSKVDRVLMPLPEKALEYLPLVLPALKTEAGWVHCYNYQHAKKDVDPISKAKIEVATRLKKVHADFQIPFGRVVRTIGPNWYQVILDIRITNCKQ